MITLQYSTGRTYDKPQVLDIIIESAITDSLGFIDIVATFNDNSRGISGKILTTVFDKNIGKAILEAYDAGLYISI